MKEKENSHTCSLFHQNADSHEPFAIFVDHLEVEALSLIRKRYFPYIERDSSVPYALAYDFSRKTIYWTDENELEHSTKTIRSAQLMQKTKNVTTIGIPGDHDLAVDWLGENLYFTNYDLSKIYACKMDGSFCTIVNNKAEQVKTLALNPPKGEMYWVRYELNGVIYKEGMDGSDCQILIERVHEATGLTVDPSLEILYWSQRDGGSERHFIMRIDLNGTEEEIRNSKVVVMNTKYTPMSLAVFRNLLFWGESGSYQLRNCNKFSGRGEFYLLNSTSLYRDIVVTDDLVTYQHSLKLGQSPCLSSLCSHVCLLAPKMGYTCACPPGMRLQSDNNTCLRDKITPRLLVWERNVIYTILPDGIKNQKPWFVEHAEMPNISFITDVAYDWYHDTYFLVEARSRVWAVNGTSGQATTIAKEAIGSINSICYDHIGLNIYWLDIEYAKIEVFTLNGFLRATLLSINASDISLFPKKGIMYALVQSNLPYITVINMDGTTRRRLEATAYVSCFALNYNNDIYWIDRHHNALEKLQDGQETSIVVKRFQEDVESLVVTADKIYWINYGGRDLFYSLLTELIEEERKLPLPKDYQDTNVSWNVFYVHPIEDSKTCSDSRCSHFCLVVPEGPKCICADGYLLHSDKRTCLGPCTTDYCTNPGKCEMMGSTIKCRCSTAYEDARCEGLSSLKNTGLLLGLLLAKGTIIFCLIVALCYSKMKGRKRESGKKTEGDTQEKVEIQNGNQQNRKEIKYKRNAVEENVFCFELGVLDHIYEVPNNSHGKANINVELENRYEELNYDTNTVQHKKKTNAHEARKETDADAQQKIENSLRNRKRENEAVSRNKFTRREDKRRHYEPRNVDFINELSLTSSSLGQSKGVHSNIELGHQHEVTDNKTKVVQQNLPKKVNTHKSLLNQKKSLTLPSDFSGYDDLEYNNADSVQRKLPKRTHTYESLPNQNKCLTTTSGLSEDDNTYSKRQTHLLPMARQTNASILEEVKRFYNLKSTDDHVYENLR